MSLLSDIFKDGFRPLGSPSQTIADRDLAKRLGEMGEDSGSGRTLSQIEALGEDRKRLGELGARHRLDANNIGSEIAAMRAATSSAAAQQPRTGVTQGGTLRNALRRAKARQGIVNRGDAAIRGQRLKDRLNITRADLRQRSTALDLQGAGQQIRAGVNLAGQSAKDQISNARAGAYGAAAGTFAGMFKNGVFQGNQQDASDAPIRTSGSNF